MSHHEMATAVMRVLCDSTDTLDTAIAEYSPLLNPIQCRRFKRALTRLDAPSPFMSREEIRAAALRYVRDME